MEPVISIYSPSIRTHYWMMQYYSLLKNDIPFEIIYTGHKKPDFDLPAGNIRFIYSENPPAVCCHNAIKEAKSEYVMHNSDDNIYSPHAIDILYEKIKNKSNRYIVFPTCDFKTINTHDGEIRSIFSVDDVHLRWMGPRYIHKHKQAAPYQHPQGFLTTKSTYYELGCFDKRLKFRNFAWDFMFRAYSDAGTEVEPCKKVVVEELRFGRKLKGSVLPCDLEEEIMLFSFWCKDDDKPERYTPYNVGFIKTWKDLEYWRDERCKEGKLTIMSTRSDRVEPAGGRRG